VVSLKNILISPRRRGHAGFARGPRGKEGGEPAAEPS
jgi:hypothetical protein